jgi:hypothetical protein
MAGQPGNELNSLANQLRADIAAAESSKRTTIVVLIILAIIMIAYLNWLTNRLKPYLNATQVAEIVINQGKEKLNINNMDAFKQKAKEGILAKVPEIVDYAADTAKQQVPKVDDMLEKNVEKYLKLGLDNINTMVMEQLLGVKEDAMKKAVSLVEETKKREAAVDVVAKELHDVYFSQTDYFFVQVDEKITSLADRAKTFLGPKPGVLSPDAQLQRETLLRFFAVLQNERDKGPARLLDAINWGMTQVLQKQMDVLKTMSEEAPTMKELPLQ